MNIFALDQDPKAAAQMHNDRHNVKMLLEYSQMLSTAHRVLDGQKVQLVLNNRKYNTFVFKHEQINIIEKNGRQAVDLQPFTCYLSAHANHPCSKWTRETKENYSWLVELTKYLHEEFEYRYGKQHACKRIFEFLSNPPANIVSKTLTPFAQAMPDEYQKENDPVAAYRAFYLGSKKRFAVWTKRPVPTWFAEGLNPGESIVDFQRVGKRN